MDGQQKFCIIILAILTVIWFALYVFEKIKSKSDEYTADTEAAKEVVLSLLSQVGLKLFTAAEREYGGGTGQLKMSSVVAAFLPLLPEWARGKINSVWLSEQLEKFLELAKEKWLNNPAMLGEKNK